MTLREAAKKLRDTAHIGPGLDQLVELRAIVALLCERLADIAPAADHEPYYDDQPRD